MEQPAGDRNDFLSRIGTFFIIISLFAMIIFIASDISRNDPAQKAGATQTYVVEFVQAIQTRDAGATLVAPQNLPTPTLVPVVSVNSSDTTTLYLPAFCLGSTGLVIGLFFKRISAPPPKPGARFEWLRKMREKQRADHAKKESEKMQRRKTDKK
jgi:hypothetical protein